MQQHRHVVSTRPGAYNTATELKNYILTRAKGTPCSAVTPYSTAGRKGRCFSQIRLINVDPETMRIFHRSHK